MQIAAMSRKQPANVIALPGSEPSRFEDRAETHRLMIIGLLNDQTHRWPVGHVCFPLVRAGTPLQTQVSPAGPSFGQSVLGDLQFAQVFGTRAHVRPALARGQPGGRETTVVNLAASAALDGARVLLADMDKQGSATRWA